MKTLPDQSEVIAQIEALRLRSAELAADIEAKTGERIAPPTLTNADIVADLAAMESHVNSLASKLNLPPGASDTVAAGVSARAVITLDKTATGRLLAAHGVSCLTELSEKRRRDRNTPRPRSATNQAVLKDKNLTATQKVHASRK